MKNKNEYMSGLDKSMHVASQNGCGCCGCLIFFFAFPLICFVGLMRLMF